VGVAPAPVGATPVGTTEGTHVTIASVARVAEASLQVVADLQLPNGAYPASPDFVAYRGYCWFRDGSFIADGMSAAGAPASATRFFGWCAATIGQHADRMTAAVEAARAGTPLDDEAMLPARFTFDGGLGLDPWWDFQLDGYGTWLWALVAHLRRHHLPAEPYLPAVRLTVDYLVSSWHRPCFDWWEEHAERVHVSTLGCIGAGLEAVLAADLLDDGRASGARAAASGIRTLVRSQGTVDGHLTKWVGRSDVDGSLAALVAPLGWISPDDPVATATVAAIEDTLADDLGVHRFADDVFYGGGRWPLLTAFHGMARLAIGDEAGARADLDWIASTATDEGLLPEQVSDRLIVPDALPRWTERWGAVATPLLWSHGEYLRLWDALGRP